MDRFSSDLEGSGSWLITKAVAFLFMVVNHTKSHENSIHATGAFAGETCGITRFEALAGDY